MASRTKYPANWDITVDKAAQANFKKVLDITERHVKNVSQEQALKIAGVFASKAYKTTPVEDKRFITIAPGVKLKKNHQYKIFKPTVSTLSLIGTKKWIFGRGFAKSGWIRAILKLKLKLVMAQYQYGRPSSKYGDAEISKGQWKSDVVLHNDVPYIEQLDRGSKWNKPHFILAKSLNQTRGWLQQEIKRIGKTVKAKAKA